MDRQSTHAPRSATKMKSSDDQACLKAALRLLGRRDHAVVGLRCKLSQRGFQPAQIAAAIAECERLRYLDDQKFCHYFTLQQRRKGYGALRIAQMLREKGVPAIHIAESLRRNCTEMTQIEDCRSALAKKVKTWSPVKDDKMTERLYRFLLSRGFDAATVRRVLDEEVPASPAE